MDDQRRVAVPRREATLDRLKDEVAQELGLWKKVDSQGWENMTTREAGSVGGEMVRKLIGLAEESLAEEPSSPQAPTPK